MMRHAERPLEETLVYTATEELCPDCGRLLPIYQVISRPVQCVDHAVLLKRRDKRCGPDCSGLRPVFFAPRDLRVVLPGRIYGLDVTLHVGERHLEDGVPLAQITRDLNARGTPLDQRHTGRVFRDFVALTTLLRGDETAVKERLRAQGGMVLMCDGVQFENRSPVLYLVWDAISGTPLFGERKPFRSEKDLVPLLSRARAMDVPMLGVVTDKEKGLVPAVELVFPGVPYQFCHTHFLKNCALPLHGDLTSLQGSVQRRAEAVRKVSAGLPRASSPAPEADPGAERTAADVDEEAPPSSSGEPQAVSAAAPEESGARAAVPPELTEEDLAREVCELVRVNSRVSGKAPLAPAELKRHERLENIRALVDDARKKSLTPDDDEGWPLLDELSEALRPSWHETRTAGRVRRHTEIIRGLAHELSNSPDRPDLPASAVEAQARVDAYLGELAASAPRAGLGAATGVFIDDLVKRTSRYGDHLFKCFDDPRIPATTNSLERFFGCSKQTLRHALGCGSTTNSVLTNLGEDVLVAYQYLRQNGSPSADAVSACSSAEFLRARSQLARREVPATRQRSRVRHLPRHLSDLLTTWLGDRSPPEPDA
ncbi:MAG: hypothetical protein HY814_14645 [Candidatus Riflebacteria bacterium]|nr:hypothetical protein [Candidatus Riflebacteria bacterium]